MLDGGRLAMSYKCITFVIVVIACWRPGFIVAHGLCCPSLGTNVSIRSRRALSPNLFDRRVGDTRLWVEVALPSNLFGQSRSGINGCCPPSIPKAAKDPKLLYSPSFRQIDSTSELEMLDLNKSAMSITSRGLLFVGYVSDLHVP
jgi:hypothetical protein